MASALPERAAVLLPRPVERLPVIAIRAVTLPFRAASSPMAYFFGDEDIEEFRECFYLYHKDGHVTQPDSLTFLMRSLGYSPTVLEIKNFWKKHHKDGKVDFAVFLDIMHEHTTVENCEEEMRAAFRVHDAQNTGVIPVKEFRSIMTTFGEKIKPQEVDRLLKEAGQTGSHVHYAAITKVLLTPIADYF